MEGLENQIKILLVNNKESHFTLAKQLFKKIKALVKQIISYSWKCPFDNFKCSDHLFQ